MLLPSVMFSRFSGQRSSHNSCIAIVPKSTFSKCVLSSSKRVMSQFVRECAKLFWGKIEEHFQNVVSFVGGSVLLLGRGSGISSFSFKNSNVFCLVFSKVWSS